MACTSGDTLTLTWVGACDPIDDDNRQLYFRVKSNSGEVFDCHSYALSIEFLGEIVDASGWPNCPGT